MNKELETLEKLLSFAFVMSENMVGLTKGNYDEKTFVKKTYEYLQKYAVSHSEQLVLQQRLETIDNAKPSEALECLEKMIRDFNETTTGMNGLGEIVVGNELLYFHKKELDTIKQVLIKAQEPKKYLEWEDLESKPYTMKVKMGDNLYMLNWSYSNNDDYDDSKSVTLRTLNGDWLFTLEKYFFNDLHLEVVEKGQE